MQITTEARRFKAFEWPLSSPEVQGMDRQRLERMVEFAGERGIRLHSALVIRHGAIVFERYFDGYQPDTPHRLFSVTKSFMATLIGIAIDQGLIAGVEQRLMDFFPGRRFDHPDRRKEAMTLEDVLTMTTGLAWEEGNTSYRQLYLSGDWAAAMLDRKMVAAPGERFVYCSGCSHLLSAALEQAAGESTLAFARRNLFDPLGMENYSWETDSQGIEIGGWGLAMPPRDMAKLGELYLRQGAWGEERVISREWVEAATAARLHAEAGLDYGYHWWINPELEAFAALGLGGQMVCVIPRLELVAVFTAEEADSGRLFPLVKNFIVKAIVE